MTNSQLKGTLMRMLSAFSRPKRTIPTIKELQTNTKFKDQLINFHNPHLFSHMGVQNVTR